MLRQLLDYLIGDAIKYALPGQPARIDISPTAAPTTRPRLGSDPDRRPRHRHPIPDQAHVFGTFHRAEAHVLTRAP